jgi:hypothetical protein
MLIVSIIARLHDLRSVYTPWEFNEQLQKTCPRTRPLFQVSEKLAKSKKKLVKFVFYCFVYNYLNAQNSSLYKSASLYLLNRWVCDKTLLHSSNKNYMLFNVAWNLGNSMNVKKVTEGSQNQTLYTVTKKWNNLWGIFITTTIRSFQNLYYTGCP